MVHGRSQGISCGRDVKSGSAWGQGGASAGFCPSGSSEHLAVTASVAPLRDSSDGGQSPSGAAWQFRDGDGGVWHSKCRRNAAPRLIFSLIHGWLAPVEGFATGFARQASIPLICRSMASHPLVRFNNLLHLAGSCPLLRAFVPDHAGHPCSHPCLRRPIPNKDLHGEKGPFGGAASPRLAVEGLRRPYV
jgi:hypothetical protein